MIEPQFKQTQRLLDQMRNNKAKDKPSMKSDKEPIPRKTSKGKGNVDKGPKKPQGRGQRYCNRCAKKSPQWANTSGTRMGTPWIALLSQSTHTIRTWKICVSVSHSFERRPRR